MTSLNSSGNTRSKLLKRSGVLFCLAFAAACEPIESGTRADRCFVTVSPTVPSKYLHGVTPSIYAVSEKLANDYASNSEMLDFMPIAEGVIYLSANCRYVDELRGDYTGIVIEQIDQAQYLLQVERSGARVQVFDAEELR